MHFACVAIQYYSVLKIHVGSAPKYKLENISTAVNFDFNVDFRLRSSTLKSMRRTRSSNHLELCESTV